jgi:hypothetical protein
MRSDHELLELAARAAGYEPQGMEDGLMYLFGVQNGWNPLADDGDAMRLAVKLGIQITPGTYLTRDAVAYVPGSMEVKEHVSYQQDMATATRRAIVRAASEIAAQVSPPALNQDSGGSK